MVIVTEDLRVAETASMEGQIVSTDNEETVTDHEAASGHGGLGFQQSELRSQQKPM